MTKILQDTDILYLER